jgi:hypothetical protein
MVRAQTVEVTNGETMAQVRPALPANGGTGERLEGMNDEVMCE